MPQLPLNIEVKDPKSALAAVMCMTLKHTADVLTAAVCAIAEKYGIDEEEMMGVVQSHPRFTGMTVEPLLVDLTRDILAPEPVAEEAVEEVVSPVPAAPVPAAPALGPSKKRGPKKLTEMTAEERAAHDAKAAERKAAKVAALAALPPPPASLESIVEPVVEPPKVMKTFRIKPKTVAPAASSS